MTVLAVLESTLPSVCLSCKIQYQETTVTVLAVSAVVAVSVVTATPLNWRVPNPPGANPLVAERAPWRSSQSCVTGGQQPSGNP